MVARIEAEELPVTLENILSKEQVNKLKQLRYEHGKAQRQLKAVTLIANLQRQLETMLTE